MSKQELGEKLAEMLIEILSSEDFDDGVSAVAAKANRMGIKDSQSNQVDWMEEIDEYRKTLRLMAAFILTNK